MNWRTKLRCSSVPPESMCHSNMMGKIQVVGLREVLGHLMLRMVKAHITQIGRQERAVLLKATCKSNAVLVCCMLLCAFMENWILRRKERFHSIFMFSLFFHLNSVTLRNLLTVRTPGPYRTDIVNLYK